MGLDPTTAVTGPDGAVHGVAGLTVADASLFPAVPRSTPALPVVALGELVSAAIA
jgi:choline dehydrogenase-like flavoprotein